MMNDVNVIDSIQCFMIVMIVRREEAREAEIITSPSVDVKLGYCW
jgi:hypothetical protein